MRLIWSSLDDDVKDFFGRLSDNDVARYSDEWTMYQQFEER